MATRRRRARKEDGTFQSDNPATPDVNEAFVQEEAPVETEAKAEVETPAEEPVAEAKPAKTEKPAVVEPVKTEEPVKREIPTSAKVEKSKITEMLEDRRKDPETAEQPKDEGLKPMTQERLQEIRNSAVTPAAVEKDGVDKIIADAGVEKTRGREIAARLMYNARRNGGFV